MADVLAEKEHGALDSLTMRLRGALTDQYIIALAPIVRGLHLHSVVVGPAGLVVLHVKDWEGEIRPTQDRLWQERLASGRMVTHPNPASEARGATRALRAFLKDEFPSLHPAIRNLIVFTNSSIRFVRHGETDPPCTTIDQVAKRITALHSVPEETSISSEIRDTLAMALVERQLTATQRATQPFVFRSGRLLGIGKKAWTIRQVIKHVDKYPTDGVQHLRNGTLATWFADEGAMHLATLARDVMRQSEKEPRIYLEKFLLGAGLVRRPRLVVLPKRVNLGRVLSGETAVRRLRLRKGRGRGYVFGTVQPSDPWIRVDPDSFSGSLDAAVRVDTEPLLIAKRPYRAKIWVDSSASDDPVAVPVSVRVVSMPSALNRYLLRPVVASVVAGLLGAGVGWLLGSFGIQAPAWATGLAAFPLSTAFAWATLTGLFWALLGAIRGFLQPPVWSIAWAAGRWLARALFWSVVLASLSALALWFMARFYADVETNLADAVRTSIILFAVALAVLPATLGEASSIRPKEEAADKSSTARTFRRALWGAIGIALVFAALAGIRLVGPAWDRYCLDNKVVSAHEWATDRWARWEAGLNDWVDQMYARYSDRRAPGRSSPAWSPDMSWAKKDGSAWPWEN